MLWILVVFGGFGTLYMLIGIMVELFSDFGNWKWIGRYAVKFLIFLVIGAVGLLGLAGIYSLTYEQTAQTGEWELVSLADSSQISGEGSGVFFYVYVSIDTNEVYSFYYKTIDNGLKKGKVDADATIIYENDDCTPHVVEYTTYTKSKMNKVLRWILACGFGESTQQTYEIYVPEGTILTTFELDSQ